jgi:hypothetical protein
VGDAAAFRTNSDAALPKASDRVSEYSRSILSASSSRFSVVRIRTI